MEKIQTKALAFLIRLTWFAMLASVQAQEPPRYKVDPVWPKEIAYQYGSGGPTQALASTSTSSDSLTANLRRS